MSLKNKDVRGFGFNKRCYDHQEYSTDGLVNEMVDTIPNIKAAIRRDGMTGVYDDGVIKLFESRKNSEGMEFIGKVNLTLVGDA